MKVKTNRDIVDEKSSKLPVYLNHMIKVNDNSPCYDILDKTLRELIMDPEYIVESTIKDTREFQKIKLNIADNKNGIKAELSITHRKENNNG